METDRQAPTGDHDLAADRETCDKIIPPFVRKHKDSPDGEARAQDPAIIGRLPDQPSRAAKLRTASSQWTRTSTMRDSPWCKGRENRKRPIPCRQAQATSPMAGHAANHPPARPKGKASRRRRETPLRGPRHMEAPTRPP